MESRSEQIRQLPDPQSGQTGVPLRNDRFRSPEALPLRRNGQPRGIAADNDHPSGRLPLATIKVELVQPAIDRQADPSANGNSVSLRVEPARAEAKVQAAVDGARRCS